MTLKYFLVSMFLIPFFQSNLFGNNSSWQYALGCSTDRSFENELELDFLAKKDDLGSEITFPIKGSDEARAYILRAPKPTMKYLFVFHEWWGLNDQIKESAQDYYKDLKDVTVICIDLYDGKTTRDEEEAQKLMHGADEKRMMDILKGAIEYVGPYVQVATIGWSFGGHWALKASLELKSQAAGCVMYYGMPIENSEELKPLKADVLGIFGMQDGWVTTKKVKQFEENMKDLKLSVEVVSYQLGHAFVNPNNPQYNRKAAKSSYKMSKEFLKSCYR